MNILLADISETAAQDDQPSAGVIPGLMVGGPLARWHWREYATLSGTKWLGSFAAIYWLIAYGSSWIEWTAFFFFYALNVMGISIGYHRMFSHRTFKTSRPMEYIFGTLAQIGAMGSALKWAADHRRHHANTDRVGDTHSPFFDSYGNKIRGWRAMYMSQFGWLLDDTYTDITSFGKGLIDDPVALYCHRTRWFWYFASIVILPAIWGFAFGGTWQVAVGCILIGGSLRNLAVLHAILSLNSLGHTHGYQNFKGPQNAQNNWFVALITLGEGWHNNHHHHANAAYLGIRWYEFDPSGAVLLGLEKLGLIWDVQRCPPYVVGADGQLTLKR
jgi:stearoyl-CoA desaturase (Delta-9 desaturase)